MRLFRSRATATTDPASIAVVTADRDHRIAQLEAQAIRRGTEALETFSPSDPETVAWLNQRGLPHDYGAHVAAEAVWLYSQRIARERGAA